jgi:calcium-dependent protein kinase
MGNASSAPPVNPVESSIPSEASSSGGGSPNKKVVSYEAGTLENGGSGGDNDDKGYFIVPLKSEEESDTNISPHNSKRRSRNKNHITNQRNTSSTSPFSSEGSIESVPIPSLHGSLLRVHRQRDPMRYYEILKVLGDGSMGSVSKVQKRKSAQGGSARRNFVKRETQHNWCWGFLDPERCGGNLFCPINKDEQQSFSNDVLIQPWNSKRASEKNSNNMDPIDEHSEPNSEPTTDNNGPNNRESRVKQFTKSRTSSIVTYEHREQHFALKSIHLDRCKDNVFRRELMNEIAILQRLDHPHIVKAMETYDYKDRLYVLLELCSGGDLYTRDPYTEIQACSIVHDILDAVYYMHGRGITHRDLKFENIMFSSPNSDAVKVIDFGLSKKYSQEEHLHETVGTVYTMAPEVLKGDYDNKCDVWSMGVIAFMLLSSSLPFYGKTRQQVVRKVLHGKYGFKGHRWKPISSEAKEFVMDCLVSNASRRKSAAQMLKHPFILKNIDQDRIGEVGFALMDSVAATIQTFAEYERVKKLALLVVAHKSTEEEIGFLRKVFNSFDENLDGEVSLPEFKEGLRAYHYEEEDLERMFVAMDLDGTGRVHYSEFLAATIEAHGGLSEERLAEAFDRLDSDDSGYITQQNILDFLGDSISAEYAQGIISEADIYHDDRISYEEFLALWSQSTDMKFKKALKDVNYRRVSFDDDASLEESMETESVITEVSGASSDGVYASADSSELGGGQFFFGVEKEKSVRGVWV